MGATQGLKVAFGSLACTSECWIRELKRDSQSAKACRYLRRSDFSPRRQRCDSPAIDHLENLSWRYPPTRVLWSHRNPVSFTGLRRAV